MIGADIFLLSFICLTSIVNGDQHLSEPINNIDVEGYYWRDYNGKIPKDAFPGGYDAEGNVQYVGQVLHNNFLIPAQIIPAKRKAAFEWGLRAHMTSKNIKILCTIHPEEFQWISSNAENLENLNSSLFIVGGYEPNNMQYIARVYINHDVSIGKLLVNDIVVLHSVKDGERIMNNSFEVLTYNPNKKSDEGNTSEKNYSVTYGEECTKIEIHDPTPHSNKRNPLCITFK